MIHIFLVVMMKDLNLAVEKYRQLILDAERYLWKHPETGYKEFETSAYMEKKFKELGYELVLAEGITGFYTVLDTKKPGPVILILAELDSIICPEHPDANPQTGAVHSCGHNAQCAALLGIAAALKEPGMLDKFCGKIKLCAVPAEELLEIEYRKKLEEEGKIKYFGGKSEFLFRGYFDDVDLAFMVHTAREFRVQKGSVGCQAKQIIYKGVASHAGGSPWDGRNALYAANCGLNAVNAIRETFQENDIIRVHPIITSGGAMVNAIPEKTVLESYVRGKTYDAICKANKKVNQALCGAALSLDTNVEIIDIPGYAPLVNEDNLIQVAEEAAALAIPEYSFTVADFFGSGSTDMGDLSCIMPVVHPYAGGCTGKGHGNDYQIIDPVAACVSSAKMQLGMLLILLSDSAKRAYTIIDEFEPLFASKEEYFAFVDRLKTSGDRIDYSNPNGAVVTLD
ncbi:MAG: amidohydrolase [Ruminococcaceae bacterium]|nr:amidohydrolase [Oscillospiraceae bacterium]